MSEGLAKALAEARGLNKEKKTVTPGAEGFELELAEYGVKELAEMLIPHIRGMALPAETEVIVESGEWELHLRMVEK